MDNLASVSNKLHACSMCVASVLAAPTASRMQYTPFKTVCVSRMSSLAEIRPKKSLLRLLRDSVDRRAWSDDADLGLMRKTVRAKEGGVTNDKTLEAVTNSANCSFNEIV